MNNKDIVECLGKEELKQWFLTDNMSGYKSKAKYLEKNYNNLYNKILENSINSTLAFKDKILLYLNDLKEFPLCNHCKKNKCNSKGSIERGISKYCSSSCANKSNDVLIKKKNAYKNLNYLVVNNKRKKTLMDKYGVDNPMKLDTIKSKYKSNYSKQYGVDNPFKNSTIKEKIIKTNLKKYGVTHLSKSKEQQKIKVNSIKNTFKIKFIEQLCKEFNINKSDVDVIGETIIFDNYSYCKIHKKIEINKNNYYSRMRGNHSICTECHPINSLASLSESEISKFINGVSKINIINNSKLLNGKEIDIYLPEYKMGIEYDGLYWHSNFFIEKNYHLNKTNLAEEKNIRLLHIFENEWLFKKEIVKSIIKSKLGIIENKIYARKTIIKELSSEQSKEFLEKNHIQGNVNAKIRIGLYYNDELVSIMTFGKKRVAMGNKINSDNEYEMLRFCNKLNTQVIGGASKLLKYFIRTYNPKSILTFADRRYSQGNLYKQLGFNFIKNTEPNYWYFKRSDLILHHRFKFRKDVLVKEGYNPNKTEFEIMNERGYYRIYDCGHMKFELRLQ